jgi:hypothetical protein
MLEMSEGAPAPVEEFPPDPDPNGELPPEELGPPDGPPDVPEEGPPNVPEEGPDGLVDVFCDVHAT